MPVYTYLCKDCGEKFDLLVGMTSEKIEFKRKKRNSKNIEKTLGSFNVGNSDGKSSSSGCAKSRLWGEYEKAGEKKGDFSYLIDPRSGKVLGCVLRTRDNVKPVFISPGHLVSDKEAKDIIVSCVGKYRLPEPIRCAHSLSIKAK